MLPPVMGLYASKRGAGAEATSRDWRRVCRVRARLHDRRGVLVRGVAAFDRPARLQWRKRVWRCREEACPALTWTEQGAAVGPRMAMTDDWLAKRDRGCLARVGVRALDPDRSYAIAIIGGVRRRLGGEVAPSSWRTCSEYSMPFDI